MAVVVPSGFSTTVQPIWWMAMWWWYQQNNAQWRVLRKVTFSDLRKRPPDVSSITLS
jgi:hypothetical protein